MKIKMSKVNQLSLKENFSWNFMGSVVYSLSQFLILVLLNKLGSPAMVGLYSIGLAITTPIIMLTNLQLRQIQATDTTDDYVFNDYFGLRIITGLVAIIFTIVIIIFSNYELHKSIIILLVVLNKVVDSYSDVIYGQLQQRERMDYIGKSRVMKGILTLVVVGLMLLMTEDLIFSLVALNLTWVLTFWFYDRNKVKLFINNVKPFFNFKKMKKLTVLALPLGVVMMLGSLDTNLPRIIVEKILGEDALGYFTSIAYLIVAGNLFIQSIGQAFSPKLAKLYKKNSLKSFYKIIIMLILLGMTIGIIGLLISLLFSDLILSLLYDVSYTEYSYLLILIMVSGIFNYSASFLGYSITAMRLFKIQPYIGLVGVIVTTTSSLILIPQFELTGAAYTLIIGSIAHFLARLIVILVNLKIKKSQFTAMN